MEIRQFRKIRDDGIHIDLCHDNKKELHVTRTTGEEINGTVLIRTKYLLQPRMVEIAFRGRSRVENNALLQPVRTYRERKFLEMHQPLGNDDFMQYDIVDNAFLYKIPFTFVVPDKLPIHGCRHPEKLWSAENAHLELPPSIGHLNRDTRKTQNDDACPDNIGITYSVEARLLNKREKDCRTKEAWNFAFKKITIIPLSKGVPNIRSPDGLSASMNPLSGRTSKSKQTATWKLFVETLGDTLPKAFLSSKRDAKGNGLFVSLKVSYHSTHASAPPQLSRISRKLVTYTEVHAVPFRSSKNGPICHSKHSTYSSTVRLVDLDMSSVQWETCPRINYDSDSMTHSEAGSRDVGGAGQICGSEAIIKVPVSLPEDVKLVPSFQSCLISRSYMLDIGLSFWGVGRTKKPSVNIQVPLEVKMLE